MPTSWLDAHTLWLDFLGTDRLVAASFSGGIVDWSSFTSNGMGPSQPHFNASLQLCHISDLVSKRLYSVGAGLPGMTRLRSASGLQLAIHT